MLELCTLASGSSGNSLLVSDGRTHILVDAGISCRRITNSLKMLGVDPKELAGVLITHEHTDHMAGLATLTKQLRQPGDGAAAVLPHRLSGGAVPPGDPGGGLFCGRHRCGELPHLPRRGGEHGLRPVRRGAEGRRGHRPGLRDAGGGAGYPGGGSPGVRGQPRRGVAPGRAIPLLSEGPDSGRLGPPVQHLSNEAGAELAWTAVAGGARTVVLAHLSHENNTPARAHEVVRGLLERRGAAVGRDVSLEVAPRSEASRRYLV